MKNNGIFTAIALIIIGVLCLLKSFGVIDFSWWALLRLWPLILIWVGIKFIPISEQWKLISKILILLLGIILLFAYSGRYRCSSESWCIHKKSAGEEKCIIKTIDGETYECSDDFSKIKNDDEDVVYDGAKLRLAASRGKLTFAPGKSLFAIEKNESAKGFITKINKKVSGNKAQITATLSPKENFPRSKTLYYNVFLSDNPIWEMELELNATASDLDLSVFQVKKLKIQANASAVDLKLGNLYENMSVDIESNASAIELRLPKDMKLIISKDNVLSSMNISGFKKQKDGSYISENGIETVGTIHITVDANVSSVEVRKY